MSANALRYDFCMAANTQNVMLQPRNWTSGDESSGGGESAVAVRELVNLVFEPERPAATAAASDGCGLAEQLYELSTFILPC